MSDLISRSELIKELNKYCGNQRYLVSENIREIINNQPIAYSVEKVVEKLEEMKMRYFLTIANTGDEKSDFAYENVGNALDKAIEIVKHGIVSDDVCEWEKGFSGYVGYPAYYSKCCSTKSKGLEMQTHIIADWKYCPYCGKKIKIVGD